MSDVLRTQATTSHAEALPATKDHPQTFKSLAEIPEFPQPAAAPSVLASEAVPSAPPAKVRVAFTLFEPEAKLVAVSGSFNDWCPETNPLVQTTAGRWETTLELAPGEYQYKFVVDGEWIPDPEAKENVWNDRGTLNSLIRVKG